MNVIKTPYVYLLQLIMDEISKLRQENHALQAKVQGLQYENQMYKQLLDNLFLKR